MSDTWSVRRILDWMGPDLKSRGVESPRLDAELLVADALGVERMALYLDPDRPLLPDELDKVRAGFRRRRGREPMAYILGYRDFYQARFEVNSAVLIPRPDSETLVERSLALVGAEPADVVDLCTGSGCIGLSVGQVLAGQGRLGRLVLTDFSSEALAVARKNTKALGVEAELRLGDLFSAITGETYDIITINPPYIREDELETLMPDVARFEPHMALVGGPSGREFLERIVVEVRAYLNPRGVVFVEVGQGQAQGLAKAFRATGFANVMVHRDLGGIERVVEASDRVLVGGETRIDDELSQSTPTEADFRGESRIELDSEPTETVTQEGDDEDKKH